MRNYTGCSGFSYRGWKGNFYPEGLPQKKQLEYYAQEFDTVEINSTFYHLPTEKTLKNWYEQVPGNFRFTLKGSKYITHQKKLNDVEEPVSHFYKLASLLHGKLGCILWQLPGNQHKDIEKLRKFCGVLSSEFRNVIEFRHNSWYDEEVYEILEKFGVTFCIISAPAGLSEEAVKTTDRVYIRFHGSGEWYRYRYSREELKHWADALLSLNPKQIYSFFNNDYYGYAPENAAMFRDILAESS